MTEIEPVMMTQVAWGLLERSIMEALAEAGPIENKPRIVFEPQGIVNIVAHVKAQRHKIELLQDELRPKPKAPPEVYDGNVIDFPTNGGGLE